MTEYTPLTLAVAALRHVVRQGVPAFEAKDGGIYCKYVDKNGNRCAIGGLLPADATYAGTRTMGLLGALRAVLGAEPPGSSPIVETARAVQVIHDKWAGADRSDHILVEAIGDLDHHATGWRLALGEDYQKLVDLTGLNLAPR